MAAPAPHLQSLYRGLFYCVIVLLCSCLSIYNGSIFLNMMIWTAFYQVIIIFKKLILLGKMGLGESKPARSKGIWSSRSSLWTCEPLCTSLGIFESCSSTLLAGRHPASLVGVLCRGSFTLLQSGFLPFMQIWAPDVGLRTESVGSEDLRLLPAVLVVGGRTKYRRAWLFHSLVCHLEINCFDFICLSSVEYGQIVLQGWV